MMQKKEKMLTFKMLEIEHVSQLCGWKHVNRVDPGWNTSATTEWKTITYNLVAETLNPDDICDPLFLDRCHIFHFT